jgi:hypothetical protein
MMRPFAKATTVESMQPRTPAIGSFADSSSLSKSATLFFVAVSILTFIAHEIAHNPLTSGLVLEPDGPHSPAVNLPLTFYVVRIVEM